MGTLPVSLLAVGCLVGAAEYICQLKYSPFCLKQTGKNGEKTRTALISVLLLRHLLILVSVLSDTALSPASGIRC